MTLSSVGVFLRITRWENVLMILFAQFCVRNFIILPFLEVANFPSALDGWQFFMLLAATGFISAAGYVVNDCLDVEIDEINKPGRVLVGYRIPEKLAWNIYFAFNAIGLILGFWLCYSLDVPQFFGVFLLSVVLLWFYSSELKKKFLAGNFVVAILAALSIILVWLFERNLFNLIGLQSMENIAYAITQSVMGYAAFSFISNFIREIIKDCEDIEGDDVMGCRTIPIVLGVPKTKILLSFFFIVLLGMLGYLMHTFWKLSAWYHVLYSFLLLFLPTCIGWYKLVVAQTAFHFHNVGLWMKWIIFSGILSIFFFYLFKITI